MANVVLKDKNGNPVTHEGITQIEAVDAAGGTQTYSELSTINCYYAAYNSSGGITIKEQIPSLYRGRGQSGVYGVVTTDVVTGYGGTNQNGATILYVVFTTKKLTVGNTYSTSYVLE